MQTLITPRYQLVSTLGQGGMGVVYKAIDRLTGEQVALKRVSLNHKLQVSNTITTNQTAGALRLALAREFQTLAGLRHPHIISVLDYGFDAGQQPFYTMSYLPNAQTLFVAGQGQSTQRKIELIDQLLQALAYLHRRGVLHRDLKPENVLVSGGVVQVLDFGLASSPDKNTHIEGGTAYYAPSETWEHQIYTPASDLYSAGVLASQLFSGRHPFGPLDQAFIDRVLDDAPDLEGVEPRLAAVLERLLSKEPARRFATAEAVIAALAEATGHPLPIETPAIRESFLQAAAFVGREPELTTLTKALVQAKAGRGSAWLIGGESGVGKSRLLDELRTLALVEGWQVWRGQAVETGGLPYQLWREIVPNLALNTELTELEASILKEIAPNIDRLLNQNIPEAPSANGAIDQERLTLTLIEAIRRQTQPTLLLFEDIQWARESLIPIKQILNRIAQLPHVLCIATYRSDERPALPAELPEAQLLMLERLSATEVQQLSQAMLGDRANAPEIVTLLTRETEGNTFFVIEVMRALAEDAGQLEEIGQRHLPAGVLTSGMENLLQRRIQRIPLADQRLLQLAAVAGRQVDLSLVALLAPAGEATGWLQRALEAAVLVVRDRQWFFSHDKLRETILHALSLETRQQLHRQIAEALETLHPADKSYHQILLEHWHQAGKLDKEIQYLEPVARYLILAVADLAKAEELLTRGLAKLPEFDPRRVALLNWQTSAYIEQRNTGKFQLALGLAQQARQLAEQVNDSAGLATSLYHLGYVLHELDRSNERVAEYIQSSLALSRSMGDQKRMSDNLTLLGEMAHHHGKIDEAIAYHQEALSVIETMGTHYSLGYSLDQLGQAYIVQGEYEKATEYLQKSYEALQAGGYEQRLSWTLLNLANPSLLLGQYEEANAHLRQSLVVFQKYDIQIGIGYCLNNLGRVATLTGEYELARNYLLQSIAIFQASGTVRAVGYNLLQLGLLLSIQGEFEQAEQYLQQSLNDYQELEDLRFVAYSLARLGFVYLHLKPALAKDTLQEALTLAHSLDIEPCILEIVFGFALLLLQQGRPTLAGELVGVAQHHPKSNKEIQLWLKIIYPQLTKALSAEQLATAIDKGKSLELHSVIQELLKLGNSYPPKDYRP